MIAFAAKIRFLSLEVAMLPAQITHRQSECTCEGIAPNQARWHGGACIAPEMFSGREVLAERKRGGFKPPPVSLVDKRSGRAERLIEVSDDVVLVLDSD